MQVKTTVRYNFISVKIILPKWNKQTNEEISKKIANVGEDTESQKPCASLLEVVKNSMIIPIKLKIELPLLGISPKRTWKQRFRQIFVHSYS